MYFSFIFQIFSVSPLFLIFLKLRYLSIVLYIQSCYTVTIIQHGLREAARYSGPRPRCATVATTDTGDHLHHAGRQKMAEPWKVNTAQRLATFGRSLRWQAKRALSQHGWHVACVVCLARCSKSVLTGIIYKARCGPRMYPQKSSCKVGMRITSTHLKPGCVEDTRKFPCRTSGKRRKRLMYCTKRDRFCLHI